MLGSPPPFFKTWLRSRFADLARFRLRLQFQKGSGSRNFKKAGSGSDILPILVRAPVLALFWASKLNLISILQIYKQFWLYKRFWASKLNFISILQIFQQFWLNKGYWPSKLNLFSIYQQEGVLDFEVEFIFILHGP